MKLLLPENRALKVNNIIRPVLFRDLGVIEYERALELQKDILNAKINNKKTEDHLLFLEHPPVFTLGKRGGIDNLKVSRQFLKTRQVKIIKTDRGGSITWHGPGQAILYPIIDIGRLKIGVREFVFGLEEVMLRTALDFGVNLNRDVKNHGVWAGSSKIGSVGLSIKKGITMHGIALNVNPDLDYFSWINPCGLEKTAMTSIEREMSNPNALCGCRPFRKTDNKDNLMAFAGRSFLNHFLSIFNMNLTAAGMNDDIQYEKKIS